jgi:hypothetical protein
MKTAMYHAVITNKGLAYLEDVQDDPIAAALTVLRDRQLTGETPADVRAAFVAAAAAAGIAGDAAALYHEVAQLAMLKVREPATLDQAPVVLLSDPPIEHYRGRHGGRRPGAGSKPRREDGQKRVHFTASLDPEIVARIQEGAASQGLTVSEYAERVLAAGLRQLETVGAHA